MAANRHATLAAVLASAVLLAPSLVESHDIYVGAYTKQGVPCCNDGDCVPAPFRFTPEGVEMLVRGVWIRVPRWYIMYLELPGDTTAYRSHWCGEINRIPTDGANTLTRCAILPPHAM